MATQQQPSDELSQTMLGALILGTPEQALISAVRQTAAKHISNGSNGASASPARTATARPRSRAKTTTARKAATRPRRSRAAKAASTETVAVQQAG